jgi:hypothetical protein
LNFLEHMGYLLRGGYVDVDGVSLEFHYWIFRFWADAEPLVRFEQTEAPIYYESLTWMVKRLKSYERSKGRVVETVDRLEVERFYREEATRPQGLPIPKRTKRRR